MPKRRFREPALRWPDRLALAFAGALFGGLTLLGYVIGCAAFFPRLSLGLAATFASTASLCFIALCAGAGAMLGPERLASVFSWLWGTHPAWESRGKAYGVAVWLVVLAVVVAGAWRVSRL